MGSKSTLLTSTVRVILIRELLVVPVVETFCSLRKVPHVTRSPTATKL